MMKICLISGEMSGDKNGALLVKELSSRMPDAHIFGLGGPEMHKVTGEIEDWTAEAAVMGIVEVLKKYSYFKKRFESTFAMIQAEKPDVLILLDYPGFNLRLAEKVYAECPSTKIAYFISPQVWAWHKSRIPKMARILDLMLCIFPFEKPLFENAGLKTEFVGHPLVDDILAQRQLDIREKGLIGLFPGSRAKEIDRHFPAFIEAALLLKKEHPEWSFETAATNEQLKNQMLNLAAKAKIDPQFLNIRVGHYHDLMDRAEVGFMSSGTATLEAALHELPYALCYKVAFITSLFARVLVKIPHIGIVNVLNQRETVRELLQNQLTPRNVAWEIKRLMEPDVRKQVIEGLREATARLGDGGAAGKAADAICNLLNDN